MTRRNRVVIERGKKKVFASAIDWPGWSRSGKTEEEALESLISYVGRYRQVVDIAGEAGVPEKVSSLAVVEQLDGNGATDFGVPDKIAESDHEPMTAAECERQIRVLHACWQYFDVTAAGVSEELRKGPRGGGRDRISMMEHVYGADRGYARRLGVKTPGEAMLNAEGLRAHREAVCDAIRAISAEHDPGARWPLRYFIRRAAWHLLDHAWEMQDKDLSGK